MTKIAILPLKEMPKNGCMSCELCGFYKFNHIENKLVELDCKILDKFDVKGLPLDYINPNCPLISIDIQELEEALDVLGSVDLETALFYKKGSPAKSYKTIKSTIDKLGGKQ